MAPGYLQASFQVREEHTLTVLRCSVLRQEIPVTAAHIPDPYFITVNSHFMLPVHTLVPIPPGGTYSLGRFSSIPLREIHKSNS